MAEITITLSEEAYQHAQDLAQRQQQNVTDAIADYLERHLLNAEEPETAASTSDLSTDPDVAREQAAYAQMHAQLWQDYPGEYVAIHNGKLVDRDTNKLALYDRIVERFPDEFVLMRRVEASPDREFMFHSTRLA